MSPTNSAGGNQIIKKRVHGALDQWPDPAARRKLVELSMDKRLNHLQSVGYAVARCGVSRRPAAEAFLDHYAADRRLSLRTVVLFSSLYSLDDDPRAAVGEIRRIASLPGSRPWPAIMESLTHLWKRWPRDMFRLMPVWMTHRDPGRRWAALHGLEIPARSDPRAALKVLRLYRGERNLKVRRMLGHVIGQGLYLRHPEHAVGEMAQWLTDGARASEPVARQVENQVAAWFRAGRGSERQRVRLLRVARKYEDHRCSSVRAHARRLMRILET